MSGTQLQTAVPIDAAEALYESLRGELDAIDLEVDLNEQDTYHLMVGLGISASSGDEQRIEDEWIKLGVLCERGVISTDQWRAMRPFVAASGS